MDAVPTSRNSYQAVGTRVTKARTIGSHRVGQKAPLASSPRCLGRRALLTSMAISADISTPIDDSKGGVFSWGKFQQDKSKTVLMYVTVPEGTRGRQVQVTFSTQRLKVVALGKELVAGELVAPVVADECTWEISEGQLLITLEKQEEGWWDRVVTSDEAVDTTTFDHEPFMLGEMDDLKHQSMRSMVSRMLGSDDPTSGKAPTLDPLQD